MSYVVQVLSWAGWIWTAIFLTGAGIWWQYRRRRPGAATTGAADGATDNG